MSKSMYVLVTGATGNQGGAVVQALLARGHQVCALTRNSASPAADGLRKQGVEIAAGDFEDYASLVSALRGVDGVYAMATPYERGVQREIGHGIALVDAAQEAGVGHFVYSSVASADRSTGIPHFDSKYEIEKHLIASGIAHTIIGPVFFMDNFLQPWLLPSLKDGKLALAMPAARPLQQVAVADIGQFATTIFERRESVFGQRYDIAGDELTGEESASILSDVSGRELVYEQVPTDIVRAQSVDLAIMFEWFDSTGYSVDIEGLRRDFPEVGWHDFKTWARKQDWGVLTG